MSTRTAAVAFAAVAVAWWLLDRAFKVAADVHEVGEVYVGNVGGLFEFKLVHNTGAAWGMFGNSTVALGVFSLVVCALIAVYLFAVRRGRVHVLELVGLALVFAGGLGNAYDRLVAGYVVDFINATFMSYPVFNIADIGVTCGIVLFLVGFFVSGAGGEDEGPGRGAAGGDGEGEERADA